ncbi:MAG TPA: pilus assembly protein TadG-related protein [Candidatus Baltobacteraceae bacterium]|jgi:hypothetical protein
MRPNSQRGQVYPLFGLLLVSFIGLSALAVDLGYFRTQERVQQTATDSAAIAAAQAAVFPSPNAENAGLADATSNGYTSSNSTLAIDTGYSDAYTTDSDGAVKVTITRSYPTFFSGFFSGRNKRAIQTTAVAKLAQVGNECLTGNSSTGTLKLDGQKMTAGSGCAIVANGTLTCNGGSYSAIKDITVNSAKNSNLSCKDGPAVSYTGIVPDPCPFVPGCLAYEEASNTDLGLSCVPNTTTCTTPSCSAPKTVPTSGTVAPGCYNAPNFSKAVVFSGDYVFVNGVTFGANVTTGSSGASFYIASGAMKPSNGSLGSTTSAFSAPSTGTYAGVLFYQPPANTNKVTISSDVYAVGMWYFPTAAYTENGKHTHDYTGDLVFSSVTFNGSNTDNFNPGTTGTAFSAERATLVE